jgi:predicted O-methyltransferase YrrM
MEKTAIIFRYFRHWLLSVNEHGVHSPFLFNLLTSALYNKKEYIEWKTIEKIRDELLVDNSILDVIDLGAGSKSDGKSPQRKISFICRYFAKSPRLCKVLFKLARHLEPSHILELGTSLGMSTMYLSSANIGARVTTIEGCPNTADVAKKNFKKAGLHNIESKVGDFGLMLPSILNSIGNIGMVYVDGNHSYKATLGYFHTLCPFATEKSVIIFDDIHWSKGMEKAWDEICKDQRVTMSVDLFHFGLVFFDRRLSKEHFRVRI